MFRIANISTFDSLQNAHNKSIGYSGESFAVSNAPKNLDTDSKLPPKVQDVSSEQMLSDFYPFSTTESKEEGLKQFSKRVSAFKKAKDKSEKEAYEPTYESMSDELWDNVGDGHLFTPNNFTAPQNITKSGQHKYQTIPKIDYSDVFVDKGDLRAKATQSLGELNKIGHTDLLKEKAQRPSYLSCFTDDGAVYVELKPGSGNYEYVGGYGEIIDIPNPYDNSKKYQIVADDEGVVRTRLVANGRGRAVTQNEVYCRYDPKYPSYTTQQQCLNRLSNLSISQRIELVDEMRKAVTTGDDVYVTLRETLSGGKYYEKAQQPGEPPSVEIGRIKPADRGSIKTKYIKIPNKDICENFDEILSSLEMSVEPKGGLAPEDTRMVAFPRYFKQGVLDKLKNISPDTRAMLLGNLEAKENSLLSKLRERDFAKTDDVIGFGINRNNGDVEITTATQKSDDDLFMPFEFYKVNKDSIERFLSVIPKEELQNYKAQFSNVVELIEEQQASITKKTREKRDIEDCIGYVCAFPKKVQGLEITPDKKIRVYAGGNLDENSTLIPTIVITKYGDDFMEIVKNGGLNPRKDMPEELLKNTPKKYARGFLQDFVNGDIVIEDLPHSVVRPDMEVHNDKDIQSSVSFKGKTRDEIAEMLNDGVMPDNRVLQNPLGMTEKGRVTDSLDDTVSLLLETIEDLRNRYGSTTYRVLEDYLRNGGNGTNLTQEVGGQLLAVLESDEFSRNAKNRVGMTKFVYDLGGDILTKPSQTVEDVWGTGVAMDKEASESGGNFDYRSRIEQIRNPLVKSVYESAFSPKDGDDEEKLAKLDKKIRVLMGEEEEEGTKKKRGRKPKGEK